MTSSVRPARILRDKRFGGRNRKETGSGVKLKPSCFAKLGRSKREDIACVTRQSMRISAAVTRLRDQQGENVVDLSQSLAIAAFLKLVPD